MDDEKNTLSGFAASLAQDYENDQPEAESQSVDTQDGNESEVPEDDAYEPGPNASEEGEEAQDEQPQADSAPEQKFKVTTGDGEELELTLEELKAGHLRQRDYTQKTQQLAEARKAQEQEIAQRQQQAFQSFQQYQQQYGELFSTQQEIARYEQALARADYHADPEAYTQAEVRLLKMRGRVQELGQGISQMQQQAEQSQMQVIQQRQAQLVDQLKREVPNFGPELVKKWESVGKQYGFTDQEMARFDDARQFKVLQDLSELAELRAKRPAAVKQAAQAPGKKTATVAAPKVEQDMQRFKKTKSLRDFAAVYAHTLRN